MKFTLISSALNGSRNSPCGSPFFSKKVMLCSFCLTLLEAIKLPDGLKGESENSYNFEI